MCVVLFAPVSAAFGLGEVKMESSGFLRRATDRADSTNTLQFGPQFKNKSENFEYKVDLFGIVQISDRSSLTFEAPEAYASWVTLNKKDGTLPEKSITGKHSISFGRKNENWSVMDDFWEAGIYSPRFTWDPTRPRKVGLTGLFYEWKNPNWKAVGFASYVNIPERGFPTKTENGKIITSDPFAQQQYESAVVAAREIPIQYSINYPPTKDLVFNPSYLGSLRYQESEDSGFFTQGTGGYLPINQVNLSVLPAYVLQQDVVDVQVYPTILSHYLLGAEAGYRQSRYSVWASYTYEVPDRWVMPDLWVTPRIEPSTITSAGVDLFFSRNIRLKSSVIYVREEEKPKVVKQDFTVDLPNRFQFHRATRAGIEVYGSQNLRYELEWTRDLEFESDLISADIYLQFLKKSGALTLNFGSDFFASSTGTGSIGRLKGNDRIRGGLAYAF
jgi:hypothetical protein